MAMGMDWGSSVNQQAFYPAYPQAAYFSNYCRYCSYGWYGYQQRSTCDACERRLKQEEYEKYRYSQQIVYGTDSVSSFTPQKKKVKLPDINSYKLKHLPEALRKIADQVLEAKYS